MNNSGFGGFVECGGDVFERRSCLVFFTGSDEGLILFLQRVEARFDAGVAGLLAGAAADPAFGGLGVRHKLFSSAISSGID